MPAGSLPSVRGDFEELDCAGATPKLLLKTSSGRVALWLDQPDKVVITGLDKAPVDMQCGRQKSAPVTIQYEPGTASQAGVMGSVVTIRFEPQSPVR